MENKGKEDANKDGTKKRRKKERKDKEDKLLPKEKSGEESQKEIRKKKHRPQAEDAPVAHTAKHIGFDDTPKKRVDTIRKNNQRRMSLTKRMELLHLEEAEAEAKKTKTESEFDGVHWRTLMKNHNREVAKRWPPKLFAGLFWTTGYYNDSAEEIQRQSRYFSRYLENAESDDELTKVEDVIYEKAQLARDNGLAEADDWVSYDSDDSGTGRTLRKLRRKSLERRHPNLWDSHDERKKEYERRRVDKRQLKKDGKPYIMPHYSPFIGILPHGILSHPHGNKVTYANSAKAAPIRPTTSTATGPPHSAFKKV